MSADEFFFWDFSFGAEQVGNRTLTLAMLGLHTCPGPSPYLAPSSFLTTLQAVTDLHQLHRLPRSLHDLL